MKPKTTVRPWGRFRQFSQDELSTVKIITVKAGEAFSLQYHKQRTEFWYIISGSPYVTIGKKKIKAKPGDEFLIKPKMQHRVMALRQSAVFLEVSFGHFDESDIVRIEDLYGRA